MPKGKVYKEKKLTNMGGLRMKKYSHEKILGAPKKAVKTQGKMPHLT